MKQLELTGLMCRLDAPSIVDPKLVAACKTYREAVRLCWDKRRVTNLTKAALAERTGLYASHVTCYLEDGKTKRDLPGWAVQQFEWECGNTAISQWFNVGAKLTPVEEMQFMRAAA